MTHRMRDSQAKKVTRRIPVSCTLRVVTRRMVVTDTWKVIQNLSGHPVGAGASSHDA